MLDAWSVALFSSRGPAFAAVENLKAQGLSTVVLEEEHTELLRFVTRMAAAAERRDLLDANAPAGAGVAFPPLKRRLRPVAPDKAADAWLARFRALAGAEAGGGAGAGTGSAANANG